MGPLPTLEDASLRPCTAQERPTAQCCFLRKSASMSCFSCGQEMRNGGEEGDVSVDGLEDDGPAVPTASKLEDTEIMSLARLFCPQPYKDTERRCPAVIAVRPNKGHPTQPVFYTDVLVIGNGPSALSLSAFLTGYRPFYGATGKHPNPMLDEKLTINNSKSLLEQDLADLCEGLEGRTGHQISLLYDYLVRPEADLGQENRSTLTWRLEEEEERAGAYIPHVVLGKGAVGGTWADLAPEVMSLSFASWLDLPAYSFREWLDREGANFATDLQMRIDATKLIVGRVPCAAVRRYYRDYVRRLALDGNVFEYTLVTSVRRRQSERGGYVWDVHGCYSGGSFHFRCRSIVLATGVTVPRQLGIPGEHDARVLHSPGHLARAITDLLSFDTICSEKDGRKRSAPTGPTVHPVLIIGDGLSAADAVIKCLINGVPVVHSFRKTPKDNQQILSKLSKAVYPEYHTVFQLMIGAANDSLYTVRARTQIERFEFDDGRAEQEEDENGEKRGGGIAIMRDLKSGEMKRVRFSRVAVLIGFEADLSFLHMEREGGAQLGKLCRDKGKLVDSKSNTILVNPVTCRCLEEPDLYAVGPLIGDNYVRYVIGGSLAVAADIFKRKAAKCC